MSWVRLALGLIREAATSEIGREVIRDVRSSAARRKEQPEPAKQDEVAEWRRSVDERLAVAERNAEALVGLLNAQEKALVQVQKRQRIWNLALAAGVVVALVLAAVALL